MRVKAVTLLGLVLPLIAACKGAQRPETIGAVTTMPNVPSPVVQPTPTPLPRPTPALTPTIILTASIPLIAEQARADLAGRLVRPISDVTIRAVELKTWSDQCLELAQPTADCRPIPVEGYRITLAVGDDEFEYHTDLDHRVLLVPTPSMMHYTLVWLQVRRENEADGSCDVWRVFQDGLVTWEAPCQNRSVSFHLPTEHFERLRYAVLSSASFTEQDDTLSVSACLYGLGAESPRSSARTTVRDLMHWLLNPAGEGQPGTCTYTNRDYAYAVNYPCNWEVEVAEEPAAQVFLYSPGRGAPYAPPFSKVTIDVISEPKGGTPAPTTLDDLEQLVLGGAGVAEHQEISLDDLSAVRAVVENELGQSLIYLVVAKGRSFILYGYGDLTAAEEVMETFRLVD